MRFSKLPERPKSRTRDKEGGAGASKECSLDPSRLSATHGSARSPRGPRGGRSRRSTRRAPSALPPGYRSRLPAGLARFRFSGGSSARFLPLGGGSMLLRFTEIRRFSGSRRGLRDSLPRSGALRCHRVPRLAVGRTATRHRASFPAHPDAANRYPKYSAPVLP
jgi:hypothetical protein